MTRQYSNLANDEVKQLLEVIANKATSHDVYRTAMTQLGHYLGIAMLDAMGKQASQQQIFKDQSVYLAATAEDADFLALGVLNKLESHLSSVGFSCFWNERTSLFGLSALSIAPVLKQYREPIEQVDTLIIVKSIISSGCVIKTNLQNLIQSLKPKHIFIAAPVMYHQAETGLSQEFPVDISNRFRFFAFAQDDERTDQGEVIPGIGGMVYDRLGFAGQSEKNSYTPTIVKHRRQTILERHKAQ